MSYIPRYLKQAFKIYDCCFYSNLISCMDPSFQSHEKSLKYMAKLFWRKSTDDQRFGVIYPIIVPSYQRSSSSSSATPGWNCQKIKQKLSNTLRLDFRYLQIIRFLHPRYHPKIIGDILKMCKKTSVCLF